MEDKPVAVAFAIGNTDMKMASLNSNWEFPVLIEHSRTLCRIQNSIS